MVLRKTSGPKRNEVTEDWRKVNNEDFHDLYSSPNVSRVIKPMGMRYMGQVARTRDKRNACRVWWGYLKE
jgi:hypothetical protein